MEEKELQLLLTRSIKQHKAPSELTSSIMSEIGFLDLFYNLFELFFIVPILLFTGKSNTRGGENNEPT